MPNREAHLTCVVPDRGFLDLADEFEARDRRLLSPGLGREVGFLVPRRMVSGEQRVTCSSSLLEQCMYVVGDTGRAGTT